MVNHSPPPPPPKPHTSLLVLDDDLDLFPAGNGLESVCALRQREGDRDERLEIDDASREEVDGGGEARGGVPGDTCRRQRYCHSYDGASTGTVRLVAKGLLRLPDLTPLTPDVKLFVGDCHEGEVVGLDVSQPDLKI